MFGSSGVARKLVRTAARTAQVVAAMIPASWARWIDARFNAEAAILKKDAAFDEIVNLIHRACTVEHPALVRDDALKLQSRLSDYRKAVIHDMQTRHLNIESMTVFLNLVQESQQLLSSLRHTMRGGARFAE